MSKAAFLVEGDLEQRFIQNVCPPGVPVRKIGCNGDKVSLTALAKHVGTQARLLQRKYAPVILVFDREKREATCEEIEQGMRNLLILEAISVKVIIGIPDREIENWILADFQMFADSSGCDTKYSNKCYEGTSGKTKIKQFLPKDKTYVETLEGVAWLKRSRPGKMIAQSASFARFAKSLHPLQCWWLQQQPELF